jgi:hypothetical protein
MEGDGGSLWLDSPPSRVSSSSLAAPAVGVKEEKESHDLLK